MGIVVRKEGRKGKERKGKKGKREKNEERKGKKGRRMKRTRNLEFVFVKVCFDNHLKSFSQLELEEDGDTREGFS